MVPVRAGPLFAATTKFAVPFAVPPGVTPVIQVALLAHHLILFAREASAGRRNASNYSAKPIEEVLVAAE